ncbi:MAG: hypothetical protein AAF670_02110 [Planctomycetota bacterium]
MWKLSEISMDLTYVLELRHDDTSGQRSFRLRAATEVAVDADVIFETQLVSHELLKSRSLSRIADEVKLANGKSFEVDAHGTWFTLEELDALEETDDMDAVEWCTATPPMLAPC